MGDWKLTYFWHAFGGSKVKRLFIYKTVGSYNGAFDGFSDLLNLISEKLRFNQGFGAI